MSIQEKTRSASLAAQTAAKMVAAMLLIAVPAVATHEGIKTVPYRDVGGTWTICYGETLNVEPNQKVTLDDCNKMLRIRLAYFGWRVYDMVNVPMSNARWAGLTSFTYNLGVATFKNSTLRKRINAGDPRACDEILKFKYVAGKDCTIRANNCYGIITRRLEEKRLCEVL